MNKTTTIVPSTSLDPAYGSIRWVSDVELLAALHAAVAVRSRELRHGLIGRCGWGVVSDGQRKPAPGRPHGRRGRVARRRARAPSRTADTTPHPTDPPASEGVGW